MTGAELNLLAVYYLQKNPYRFNKQEKEKFLKGLQEWIDGKSETIDDVVIIEPPPFAFIIGATALTP